MLNDTICAISTALNNGAIAIVRLSGDEAIDVADKICDKDLHKVKSHSIIYAHVIENGANIDEVMISIFKAPKTYTK